MRFDPPRPGPLLLLALSLALSGCDRLGEPPPPSLAEAPRAAMGRADAEPFADEHRSGSTRRCRATSGGDDRRGRAAANDRSDAAPAAPCRGGP